MPSNRTKLPRCEYGVPANTEEGVEDCGEPAIARWDFEGDIIHLCELHDVKLAEEEDDAASGD